MDLTCANCKSPFKLDRIEYRKRLKEKGTKDFFCSKSCSDDFQRSKRPERKIPEGMKYCTGCDDIISPDQFAHREEGRVRGLCKKCLFIFQYRRWNKRKVRAIEFLGGRCAQCGRTGHPVIFDFHHRDPDRKEFGWSRLRRKSWDKVVEELRKCDLLCVICHRLHHINPDMWNFLPS